MDPCVQVSYTASSPVFENKTKYPRFFRMIPISKEFANGYAALIKEQGWKKVAVISSIDDFTYTVGDNMYLEESLLVFLYTK